MKNFIITFLFLIFATNNILFAEEITVYNKANAEKCVQGNCVNGQGILTWTDGTKYEGEFKDEKMTGQGTFTHKDYKYVGELKDSLFNGQGTITWPDTIEKYVGEWKDDKWSGQGTYVYANGDKYVGEWKDDKRNGQGTLTFADGRSYVGEWKDDKSNGQGTLTLANGTKYVGEFKDNKSTGQGTLTYPNGNKYVGEFKDNKQTGQGTLTFADGRSYVGEFKDGKYNGKGTYTYKKGHKYVGEFKDDSFNGQGTLTFANGNKRVGEWKDDKAVDGKTKFIETAANKRKRIEDEKRQRAKEINDQQRVTNQFTKIKTEAINAINKAQSCYNSLGSTGQSQIRSNLVDAKATFNDAKKLERDLMSMNGDVTQSAGVYQSATTQANVVVNIMCN